MTVSAMLKSTRYACTKRISAKLGVVPEMKYPNEGGPDLKACFYLLLCVTRPSAPKMLRFLDYGVQCTGRQPR
jgi:hypothetical protein